MAEPKTLASSLQLVLNQGNFRLATRVLKDSDAPHPKALFEYIEMNSDRAPAIHVWLKGHDFDVQHPFYHQAYLISLFRRDDWSALNQAIANQEVTWPAVGTDFYRYLIKEASNHEDPHRLVQLCRAAGWGQPFPDMLADDAFIQVLGNCELLHPVGSAGGMTPLAKPKMDVSRALLPRLEVWLQEGLQSHCDLADRDDALLLWLEKAKDLSVAPEDVLAVWNAFKKAGHTGCKGVEKKAKSCFLINGDVIIFPF